MSEVVDDKLKVKGVEGLRVIDASVFPGHVSGNIVSRPRCGTCSAYALNTVRELC